MKLKKLTAALCLSLALALLAACGTPGVSEPTESASKLTLPESVAVDVTLPDADPVTLPSEEAAAMQAILKGAALAEEPTVASVYLAEVVLRSEDGTETSYLVYEGKEGGLVITAPGGQLALTDTSAFYSIISDDLFAEQYAASAPYTLVLGETDCTASVSAAGALSRMMPNGVGRGTAVEVVGDNVPVAVDSVDDVFAFTFEVQPTESTAFISQDGEEVYSCELEAVGSWLPVSNGVYDFKVVAAWKDGGRTGFNGSCTYTFSVSYELPVTVQVVSADVVQGQPIVILIRNAEEIEVDETGIKYDAYFIETGATRALVYPTHYNTPAGSGEITITTEAGTATIPFTIQEYDFEVQELTVSEELAEATIDNGDANYEYNQAANRVNSENDDGVVYFTEPFLQPVEGEVTADFGMNRYVNGVSQSVHAAVDFAADEGTPVAASNSGRVVFAEYLELTGNTVVIEHGGGIKTWYFHMSKLEVEEGQTVTRGETIGLVGSTGFSTGPHLHFATTIDGIYVSPWYVIGQKIFDQEYRGEVTPWDAEEETGEETEED